MTVRPHVAGMRDVGANLKLVHQSKRKVTAGKRLRIEWCKHMANEIEREFKPKL